MLHNVKDLYGNKISALDGDIGHVKDFYFDDTIWVIRYMVADTGNWLSGREVLLSPYSFGPLNQEEKAVLINLTHKQVEGSPLRETHEPVSRQYELEYFNYYGWPYYRNNSEIWGVNASPMTYPPTDKEMVAYEKHHENDDGHLRSTKDINGYLIEATDSVIGHVSSFLVDDWSWAIRELVVETGHWYSGKEITISPCKIERISYEESKVFVNLTKEEIQKAAEKDVVLAGALL